ncbi:MAG TPA: ribosome biogenesis GTPase Der [Methylomirabilota bacterium]|nr:ribosome biogenesis GTPase Der [Methylomirabilota bacterium]
MSRLPVVVIVGRPNVGKSTLFNRLTRSRRALVHDLPGVTRDRIVGEAERPGGGRVTVVDTGGLLLGDEDGFVPLIRSQAEVAIADSDVVVLLLDGDSGPIPEDREIAAYLRTLDVPVVPVVNKADRKSVELQAHEFFRLGLGEPVAVSAEHGTGIDGLWSALEPHLPELDEADTGDEAAPEGDEIHVAVIGRPNVGKSSLVNQLVGDSRVLVSEVPGTTRDAVDVICEVDGERFRFVDTAGIRRKGRTDKGPEVLSVVMARRHLERAQICLLLVDPTEGVTRQDGHVAGYAWDAGRGLVLVVNKWDLVEDRERARAGLDTMIEQQLKFLRQAPRVYLSALTGKGVHRLFPAMRSVHRAHGARIGTTDLNRVVKDAFDRHPPAMAGKRAPKLYYCTQVNSRPPHFVLFTNLDRKPHFSWTRHMENVIRDAFSLEGVPFRVMIRGRMS